MLKNLLRNTLPFFTAASAMAQTADHPNIIFFLADDQGWQDTSLPFWDTTTPQNTRYRTPNMERLAQRGMMFTNAYACPVSSPSRSSLISGMNAARHGVTNWIEGYDQNTNYPGSSLNLPEWSWNGVQPAATATSRDRVHSTLITPLPLLLKQVGYTTIHCGKGNFGSATTSASNPSKLGFDVNIAGGYAGGPGSYLAQDNYGSAIQAIGGLEQYAAQGVFLTEALTQEAIKNLDKAVAANKPFYLYMSHYAIHTPYQADTRFTSHYQNFYDSQFGATLSTDEVNRAALIEGMDKSLGDLMDWLDQQDEQVARNTVILFMSDNGGHAVWPRQGNLNHDPNYPSRGGKGSAYDGGVHEPMIIAWPGVVQEGAKNHNRVMIEDFFPSILEMAGISDYTTVQTVDGISFVDLIKQPSLQRDRTLIWHYPHRWGDANDRAEGYTAWSAIMKGDYHLIYFWENQERQLFNIRQDIGEAHNLALDMPELTLQLAQELTDSLIAYGAGRPTIPATGQPVPWPVDGVQMAGPGDPVDADQLGIQLSTPDGEKHLYYVLDARAETDYWTQGSHHGYPAIQTYVGRLQGDEAARQQFYFMRATDSGQLLIYTADGQPVSYTLGTTRSGYTANDKVQARYLQYGTAEPTPLQAIMTDQSDYFGLVVNGEYLSNRGSANGAANNLGWVVMPYSGSYYTDLGCRFKFVSIDADPNAGLPRLTTDTEHPIYYRIRNTRCYAQGKASYALFRTTSSALSLTNKLDRATRFYFTGTVADGVVTAKIHNDRNNRLMAGEALWSTTGCDWYIKTHVSDQGGTDTTTGRPYEGVLICNSPDFQANWYVGSSDTAIKLYGNQWDGNIFTLEKVEDNDGIPGMPDNEQWTMDNGAIFDLSGRRMPATMKGVYIQGGRKILK